MHQTTRLFFLYFMLLGCYSTICIIEQYKFEEKSISLKEEVEIASKDSIDSNYRFITNK